MYIYSLIGVLYNRNKVKVQINDYFDRIHFSALSTQVYSFFIYP